MILKLNLQFFFSKFSDDIPKKVRCIFKNRKKKRKPLSTFLRGSISLSKNNGCFENYLFFFFLGAKQKISISCGSKRRFIGGIGDNSWRHLAAFGGVLGPILGTICRDFLEMHPNVAKCVQTLPKRLHMRHFGGRRRPAQAGAGRRRPAQAGRPLRSASSVQLCAVQFSQSVSQFSFVSLKWRQMPQPPQIS